MSEFLQNERVVLIFGQQMTVSVIYKNSFLISFVRKVFIVISYSSAHSSLTFNYEFSKKLSFNAKKSLLYEAFDKRTEGPRDFACLFLLNHELIEANLVICQDKLLCSTATAGNPAKQAAPRLSAS